MRVCYWELRRLWLSFVLVTMMKSSLLLRAKNVVCLMCVHKKCSVGGKAGV